ncbi:hypothetical protein [Pseudoalteromonas aliena]|nr:hypothetical protein [Pseudoalteromonas aliena]
MAKNKICTLNLITLLQIFTKGLYGVYQKDEQVIIRDLRMGWKVTTYFYW